MTGTSREYNSYCGEHWKLHRGFGISHLVLGTAIALLDLVDLVLLLTQPGNSIHNQYTLAPGIFCGVLLMVTGVLQLLCSANSSECRLIAALVMDVLTAIILIGGLVNAGIELDRRLHPIFPRSSVNPSSVAAQHTYSLVKVAFITVVCCVTLATTIVHSGFTCCQTCSEDEAEQDVTVERTKELVHPRYHRATGAVHQVAGVLLVLLEIVGFCLPPSGALNALTPAAGIWAGLPLVVTGVLQLCAGVKDSRRCLIAALTFDIITALILAAGLSWLTTLELFSRLSPQYPTKSQSPIVLGPPVNPASNSYNLVKAAVILGISAVALISSIVHSGFSSLEVCCRKRSPQDQHQQQDSYYSNPQMASSTIYGRQGPSQRPTAYPVIAASHNRNNRYQPASYSEFARF